MVIIHNILTKFLVCLLFCVIMLQRLLIFSIPMLCVDNFLKVMFSTYLEVNCQENCWRKYQKLWRQILIMRIIWLRSWKISFRRLLIMYLGLIPGPDIKNWFWLWLKIRGYLLRNYLRLILLRWLLLGRPIFLHILW